MNNTMRSLLLTLVLTFNTASSLSFPKVTGRRSAIGWIGGVAAAVAAPQISRGAETKMPDSLNVDDFLLTGRVSQPMGVSGQAGKSRPETGVVLRDGSEVSRDKRSGDVLAEIVVDSKEGNKAAVLASYTSPWPLATGSVFDVECRDANTGDGAFLAVSNSVSGKSIDDVKDAFILKSLLKPDGRFGFYGEPTDVKVVSSEVKNDYKLMDVSFSTISQATQTSIPRKARLAATVPADSNQVVMLVGYASASRWRKGSDKTIGSTIESFRAVPAPQTGMKIRGQERGRGLL